MWLYDYSDYNFIATQKTRIFANEKNGFNNGNKTKYNRRSN